MADCRFCHTVLVVGFNQIESQSRNGNHVCDDCRKAKARARAKANPEQERERAIKYRVKHKDKIAEYQRSWREDNIERLRSQARDYYRDNVDRFRAWNAAKRARVKQATPLDADLALIKDFYRLASILREHTGAEYHVDHIVPFAAGGLHHQDNLQVLRSDYNLRKNKYYNPSLDINIR